MASRRAALQKIATAAVGLLMATALAEGLARLLFHPFLDLDDVAAWNVKDFARTHRPLPNRFGHREDELSEAAFEPGVERILFLGDSFTYGQGVFEGSARFTDRIEAHLRDTGHRVDVYNAGVNGSNPSDWTSTLDVLLPAYRPQVVFAVFFLRSGAHLPTSFRFYQEMLARMRSSYEALWIQRASFLYRAWADLRIRRAFTREYVGRIREAYLGDEAQTGSWKVEQAALRALADRCARQGIPFRLVQFPMLFQLDDYPFDPVESEVERFAREAEIPFFSLTPGFRGRDATALWVSPTDQHPNEAAHAITADTLYLYVETSLSALGATGSGGRAAPFRQPLLEEVRDLLDPLRHRDPGGFHPGDLLGGGVLLALDNRPGVPEAHALHLFHEAAGHEGDDREAAPSTAARYVDSSVRKGR